DTFVFLYAETDDPEAARNGKPARLGETWTPEERALAIEKLLPELQTPSKHYRRMVEALLGVLLPPEHPAFTAAEAEWQAWWNLARPVVLKTPLRPLEPDTTEIGAPK
ncbi:MAG: hypothetical protein KIS92_06865, partial [Planctomycetota bacterium]|nr:hypothetical protein [Planctomycetota bacterium]